MANDDNEWEDVPSSKSASTVTAKGDDEWEDVPASKPAKPSAKTVGQFVKPNLPGATPALEESVRQGIAPNYAPTDTEKAHPQLAKNYGFNLHDVLKGVGEGIKGVAHFGQELGKDISDPNRPMLVSRGEHNAEGKYEHPNDESLFHKYALAPSEAENKKAQSGDATTLESIGHSTAAAIPLVGPWVAAHAEKAGQTGNIGGEAAALGTEAGIGKLGEKVAHPVAEAAVDATGRAAGAIPEAIKTGSVKPVAEAVVKPLSTAEAPEVAAQRAVKPSAKYAEQAQKNIAGARPYLEGASDLQHLQAKVVAGKAEVWKHMEDALEKVGDNQVEGPDGDMLSVNDLEKERLKVSAQLDKVRGLRPVDRQGILQKQGDEAALTERYSKILGSLDPELEAAGIDPKKVRSVFGNLKGVEKLIQGKNTLTEADRAYGLGRMMEDFHVTKPLRAAIKAKEGVGDILAGRPWFKGKPTDVAVNEGFNAGAGGEKPDFSAPVRPPKPAVQAAPPFEVSGANQPNRTGLWDLDQSHRQVGELPDIGFGGPHTPVEKPLGPIQGEQMPMNLPGAEHELFNLPQTPRVPGAEAPITPIHGQQLPMDLPGAHHELFNLQQTPRLPNAEPPITPVNGEQMPMNLPPPEAELFHIQQTAGKAGVIPKGNLHGVEQFEMANAPGITIAIPETKVAQMSPVELHDAVSKAVDAKRSGPNPAPTLDELKARMAAEKGQGEELPPIGGPNREGILGRIGESPTTEEPVYKPSEKVQTMSAKTKDLGPEWRAGEAAHELERNKEILRNPKATEEDKRIAQSRMDEGNGGEGDQIAEGKKNIIARTKATIDEIEKSDIAHKATAQFNAVNRAVKDGGITRAEAQELFDHIQKLGQAEESAPAEKKTPKKRT